MRGLNVNPAILVLFLAGVLSACSDTDLSENQGGSGSESGQASQYTVDHNRRVAETLSLDNPKDFEQANRGLIARDEQLEIKDELGRTIWNMKDYDFVQGDAPNTVNPSLWRQAKLNNLHGLYKVSDGIYQLRGYDLSNMTLIEGETGWIVVDPLTTKETAEAALAFARTHLGDKPVSGLIMTHSHVDHFGGALAVLDPETQSDVPVVAPEHFMAEATSENILAGPTMKRRAVYMYGRDLPKSPYGHVDTGLGKAPAFGTVGIVPPNILISKTGETHRIDGVEFQFQYTPNSEAPAELTFYLPKQKAFCGAELLSRNMHNLYTLRGAKVRDALAWSAYIEEARLLYKDADIYFASHHWPIWGQESIDKFLRGQRDTYKYIHDQTLRLAYKGHTPKEISEMIRLPESLASEFSNRGYYGTTKHNSKAVYQAYFGWYDANPANLNPLPPEAASVKYIEAMGGEDAVLQKGQAALDQGEYRWAAELLNHLVFAGGGEKAKELLAQAYTQLGYQAESGPWRDVYLSAAVELKNGPGKDLISLAAAKDLLKHAPVEKFFDAMAAQLNGPDAEGEEIRLNVHFSDLQTSYQLWIENSVLHYRSLNDVAEADASLRISHDLFLDVILGTANLRDLLFSDQLSLEGSQLDLLKFFSLLDKSSEAFAIVEP
ncbi:alkyl/aryl-sulfatase [Pseudoteredinibacter isoporae]|uniref:Alkyl sulfatase BDS1-like metallo-beta-lactamase superfamily hydrolase n=1 Tax=Pseudoteredinibacter isoporae TaxID=570281 RepID=A0A7X0MUN6_9GAMM|nr:alkyl sulfatase dimerization domain-containing protein [Pseudoteredinibacter isoporae]MBB6520473.1 alkyl sulfatase BDS1-like metallo-beta-lactamase superfamily hydrolase [Pseudoteredinibacter isoporae]NHO86040.1 MBL fold metallo-hydrolase [Pseudoteredinibacter isoporae]NIB25509.1 MBL fold metallo-hydrolase [Pseudoteredinibacter isoporae]